MSQSIRLNSQDSYEIKIYGQLDDSRLGWFAEANAHVEVLADSSQVNTFSNVVMDQAGLVGLIRRLHGHRVWTVKNGAETEWGGEYLIGGAIAEWAGGEPRATQDLNLVVKIPIKAINKLSKELEKWDMLIPGEIILDSILEDRADIPINAIHMYSGLKADLYPVREGDELRNSAFQRREQVDYGPPIGEVYIHSPEDLILYKLIYFGLSQQSKHTRDIAAILKSKKNELYMHYTEQWVARLGLLSLWKEMLDNVS